ncbi:MAG: GtrA family protein [Patescibacteria group bacterium]
MNSLINTSTFKQLTKFCLIGLLNTGVDFSVYISLTRIWPFWAKNYLVANIISFLVANFFSFWVNKFWTFENREPGRFYRQYGKFLVVSLVALAIVESTLYILVEHFGFYDLLAKMVGIAISLAWSFLVHRYWTFKRLIIKN